MLCPTKIKDLYFEFLSKLLPQRNYIPKEATQQVQFLSQYPEFDGRKIKIAVIDYGIDVSHEGMQKTSKGLPKIIDCFDFTGAGDVDTSAVREMNSERILCGLSGRKFKIPQKWENPTGKWHLGLKSLYKPYQLSASKTIAPAEKLKEVDCIVWNDGKKWLACIGTLGKDLGKAKVLTNFRDEHDYGSITLNGIKVNYCVTIQNDGKLLQIFTAFNDHGSLVAEVAAASYFPRNSGGEGLAPGSQIISMNVLDPKNNFTLSLTALHKAFLKCREMKVDIINYSMGYFTTEQDDANLKEEFAKLVNEMAIKDGILIFKSVGNEGPFYATSSKDDPRIQNVIFRIGAMLTSDIRKRFFNASGDDVLVAYPFSSRGPYPIADEDSPCGPINQGLEFMAPGAFFSLHKNRYIEGTSASSPNAAGAVACLLSGLKARAIPYSYSTIKFVLFKTAFLPETQNQFVFGHGIIQIFNAFDYFCKNDNISDFKISIFSNGIFCGQYDEGILNQKVNLSNFIDIASGEAAAAAERWTLEASQKSKNFIELLSQKIDEENSFTFQVNFGKLESGTLDFAEITIMHPLHGSIFSIPIMVNKYLVVTETQNCHIEREISLIYENPFYIFFHPIFENNTSIKKCELKFAILGSSKSQKNQATKLWIEYFACGKYRKADETKKTLIFTPKASTMKHSIPIENSTLHGLCIYQQNGSSHAVINLRLEIDFKDDQKKVEKMNT